MRMTLGRLMVAFGAICIGLVFLYAYRMSQVEAELVAAQVELEATLLGLETTRPVLQGEAIEGLAFDHYGVIGGLLTRRVSEKLAEFITAHSTANPSMVELRNKLLDDNSAALRTLQLGARSTDARYATDWTVDSLQGLPKLMETRSVVNLTVLAAERHLDEGHPELAVDVLLDGLQLGRDMTSVPIVICEMVGVALLAIPMELLLDEPQLARFPRPELERLAQALKLLDEAFPEISYSAEGESLYLAKLISNPSQSGHLLALDWDLGLWAHGFSGKALYADHIRGSMQECKLLHDLDNEPWSVREIELSRQQAESERSQNFLTRKPSNHRLRYEIARRESIARLRLARALIEFKLTGAVPTIADPFGGNLRVSTIGDKTLIESAHAATATAPERFRVETE